MPLPTPNLDNREFEDLMAEVRSLIPRYNGDWTNFNSSDPGIALFELFAWFAEQTQFRINQVPGDNYLAFLRLLGTEPAPGETIEQGIRRALALVNERYRAVTSEDYESLTLQRMDELEPGLAGRAIVVNNADLKNISANAETFADVVREANVSVILVPRNDTPAQQAWCDPAVHPNPAPSAALIAEIEALLQERRLITTRVHAAAPVYRPVELEAKVVLRENTDAATVTAAARARTIAFFDPLDGGPDGLGWPPGRAVYRSEYYQILEETPGVDHVDEVVLRLDGLPVGDIKIRPWELIALETNAVSAIDE